MIEKDKYSVDLLGQLITGDNWKYEIDDSFFKQIDGIIEKGNLSTEITFNGVSGSLFKFTIHSVGTVAVPCDRCLADVELRIDTTDEFVAKLGEEYSDDGDCVVVPENDGMLDLSLLIYEFIVLSMPYQRVHQPGDCDEAVMNVMKEHQVARSNQEEEAGTIDSDPDADADEEGDDAVVVDARWDALKKLINK